MRVRSIPAFAARYLVMASTSLGVAAFQEPPPALSWLDPWWLGGAVALAALAWRFAVVARARRPEAAFWLWAAVSYAPVCQIFPFVYPLGDRYLYFILPGLLGGVLLVRAFRSGLSVRARAGP